MGAHRQEQRLCLIMVGVAASIAAAQPGCLFPDYTFGDWSGGAGGTSGSTSVSGTGGAMGSTTSSSASSTTTLTSSASSSASGTSSSASASSSTSTSSSTSSSGVVIAPGDMIDNMEAGTGSILSQGGRIGSWYTYNDGSAAGTQTPLAGGPFAPEIIPGGNGASTKAARTHGDGFSTWGAGMGFDLHNTGMVKSAYDVSAFQGIAFTARGEPGTIRFKVLTSATVASAEGGLCMDTCGDSHGAIVALGSGWAQIAIPFSMLTQEGWGSAAAWDPTQVLSVQFQSGPVTFDFWIDDIGLY